MKRIISALVLVALVLVGCSSDADDDTINGVWVLTEWNIANGFDINNDGIISTNILNEIDCVNNETLVFDTNGVVTSNNTFNPSINIALVNGTSNNYLFNVECDQEGIISFASNFTVNGNMVLINDGVATVNGNTLSRVFTNAIKIYNENFTQVIATKDLTLVYTKQ
ncbi:hypothetical protein ACFQ1R_05770 [Mariniflexile jejuense]|uniref:Lipocalin-like domain-containing protein n=1 Tax=Mariniflexile jejuense TaxID=1173582 RepID=A0ABW3JGH6_9FLAO